MYLTIAWNVAVILGLVSCIVATINFIRTKIEKRKLKKKENSDGRNT